MQGSPKDIPDQGRVFSIRPGSPFLRSLCEALLDGSLFPGFDPLSDPLSLGEALVYLPTRRAARAFSAELGAMMKERSGRSAFILPRIRTIGDIDEEEILLGLGSDVPAGLGKPASQAARLLTLARLARKWTEAMTPRSRDLLGPGRIVLPSSVPEALSLAQALARLMDQVETEEVEWDRLVPIFPEGDVKLDWWQITLAFLDIVMRTWPALLEERCEINPAEYRRRVIDFRTRELARLKGRGPVIAAGSTGSIPATARLLQAIARMQNGAVVLPGIDGELPGDVADAFCNEIELLPESAQSTHAQYGLCRLARTLGLRPAEVTQIGEVPEELAARERILNLALLPPGKSAVWHAERASWSAARIGAAFANVSLIEAPAARQEGLAIALAMREALETPDKTAILVTPDRDLARRVAAELERFGIGIDDSAGRPLASSPACVLARLALRVVLQPFDPVVFAGFLKQPGLLAGRVPAEARHLAELSELIMVRDVTTPPDPEHLPDHFDRRRSDILADKHAHAALKRLTGEDWAAAADWVAALSEALRPLRELRQVEALGAGQLLEALMAGMKALTGHAQSEPDRAPIAGLHELEELCLEFSQADRTVSGMLPFEPDEAVAVFDRLVSGRLLRRVERSHPRLQIYGQLEARLQSCDLMILAGLNEGTWPQAAVNDPFLNRPMRSTLGLPLPERRIGLSAHDFCQFSGSPEVIYSRALRSGQAPSIASRWLQRLGAFLGADEMDRLSRRGRRFLDIAATIDRPGSVPRRVARPCPTPPVEARPKRLSVTEIETWIRDPYAIYARHVLHLAPLPALVAPADALIRGTLYHDILAEFVSGREAGTSGGGIEDLEAIAQRHFAGSGLAPEVTHLWLPRFMEIARRFLDWEAGRQAEVVRTHCETGGRMVIGKAGFTLSGRADRIDELADGSYAITDYKTGAGPSPSQARSLSPQLALEGAILAAGGFENVPAGNASELLYLRLRPGLGFKPDDITRHKNKTEISVPDLISRMSGRLTDLIQAYGDARQGYVSRYAPKLESHMSGDYDHLARVMEWSLGDDEDEAGDAE